MESKKSSQNPSSMGSVHKNNAARVYSPQYQRRTDKNNLCLRQLESIEGQLRKKKIGLVSHIKKPNKECNQSHLVITSTNPVALSEFHVNNSCMKYPYSMQKRTEKLVIVVFLKSFAELIEFCEQELPLKNVIYYNGEDPASFTLKPPKSTFGIFYIKKIAEIKPEAEEIKVESSENALDFEAGTAVQALKQEKNWIIAKFNDLNQRMSGNEENAIKTNKKIDEIDGKIDEMDGKIIETNKKIDEMDGKIEKIIELLKRNASSSEENSKNSEKKSLELP